MLELVFCISVSGLGFEPFAFILNFIQVSEPVVRHIFLDLHQLSLGEAGFRSVVLHSENELLDPLDSPDLICFKML